MIAWSRVAMARSGSCIAASFASTSLSPSALSARGPRRAAAFSSWARSLIAARSSSVNPLDALPVVLLVGFCVPFASASLPVAFFSDISVSFPVAFLRRTIKLSSAGRWGAVEAREASMRPASAGRVAGRHYCLPAPSEPYVIVAHHTAQAFTNAPRGTRSCPHLSPTMDLPVTVRMQQFQVLDQAAATVHAPLPVVQMPLGLQRQRLTAHRTETLLL